MKTKFKSFESTMQEKDAVETRPELFEKKELPRMTVFLIRHGESESDKTNPNRGLTEKGRKQVTETFNKIMESLLREQNPDFGKWHNKEAKEEATKEAIRDIEFHLRDSGTARTLEQVWFEYQKLKELGVPDENINLAKSAFEYKGLKPDEKVGPGIAKRLKGVQGLDQRPEFRRLISSEDFQKKVGAKSDVMAWALAPEEEVPEGVEKRHEMEARYQKDLAVLEKVVDYKMERYPKRVVAIANSHASIATVATAMETGIPMEKIMETVGEVPEAQGLRYDFYGGAKAHQAQPFGEEIEKVVKELKE